MEFKLLLSVVGLMLILNGQICYGDTDARDILAINSLYAALGYPPLPGWLVAGGDPCAQGWQGVLCVNSNITGIILNGANLGGELGENLGAFASIILIDLGNNHIGGPIPSNLPPTVKILTLSGNQLTGTIPDSISLLGQMTDFNLNNNHLTGVIPDSFQQLTPLTTMDLSANNLSGPLPPSMARLSSMTTLHLQDNHLTGLLDVLQDLPLIALDVGNNLFSGPIPPRLLTMPNFRSAGNPFNTTIIPSPPLSSPSPSSIGALPPDIGPGIQIFGHSPPEPPHSSGNKSLVKNKLVWVGIGGFLFLIVLASGLCFFMSKRCKEKSTGKVSKDGKAKNFVLNISTPTEHRENDTKNKDTLAGSSTKGEKIEMISKKSKNKEDHVIDMTKVNASSFPTPLLPPQPSPLERVVVKPLVAPPTTSHRTLKKVNSTKFFSIASLQEYTDSFSQENLVGSGMLATVYKAELPNGKQLAIKKLDDATSQKWNDERFIELVSNVSKLRNENIVALEGYCLEHGKRLFVYEYCENGTLHEALHLNDEMHEKLSWNSRVHVALQIAKALEYLHEVCQPPVVHHNLKSTNILFDNELNARVSDCGLAPLLPSSNISQLQSSGYGAPELELGSYTYQSDVYSFGVIMLELITGRKAFDSSKPRGEQYLVRWANSRLHDIEELSGMVDPSIRAAISSKALSRFADIISLCVQVSVCYLLFKIAFAKIEDDVVSVVHKALAKIDEAMPKVLDNHAKGWFDRVAPDLIKTIVSEEIQSSVRQQISAAVLHVLKTEHITLHTKPSIPTFTFTEMQELMFQAMNDDPDLIQHNRDFFAALCKSLKKDKPYTELEPCKSDVLCKRRHEDPDQIPPEGENANAKKSKKVGFI